MVIGEGEDGVAVEVWLQPDEGQKRKQLRTKTNQKALLVLGVPMRNPLTSELNFKPS